MPRTRILSRQTIPGGNFGETFTASLADRPVLQSALEQYWDSAIISFRGTLTTTVLLETFLNLVNPFTFIAGEPRVVMRGRDIFALDNFWYQDTPPFDEGSTGTTNDIKGLRVPLWIKPSGKENYSYSVTRVAVTNIASEVIDIALNWNSIVPAPAAVSGGGLEGYHGAGRIDAREIPFTTPGATGITQVTPKLPKLGKLLGLLCFGNTVPTNAAVTATIQNIYLDTPQSRLYSATWSDLQANMGSDMDFTRADATAMVRRQVLQNYGWMDFRDDPIDLIANDVALSIDAEATSDAARFVPIIELAAPQ